MKWLIYSVAVLLTFEVRLTSAKFSMTNLTFETSANHPNACFNLHDNNVSGLKVARVLQL